MAPATNGTVLTDFEQHQREVVNTFARAALAMHDAAKVAEEFSNWFARANNVKDIPSPTFNFGSIMSSSSDVAVSGKKRKADKEASPSLDQNGKKKRVVKEKKPRDKDAPKRPPSAYLLFQNEVRKEIKNEHPGMTNHEILQEVSKLWNTVSEQEKKTYLKSHNDLKTKYDEEKAAYDAKLGIAPNTDEKKKEEKAKKTKKTTPPPKGNKTVRAKPNTLDESDEGSPKDEEEDEPEQEEGSQPEIEVTEEDEEEGGEEDEDEIEDSEVESESETPRKKAKTDAVHANSRKRSPPGVKGKEKEKSTKVKYHEEEKKKKKH
ncbi:hypothetical protein Clacol_001855 [Clathrus columnatus]|uniref:HMG box domain-containing protein n=1 Tax=Clathrus columnatus TaxID=1419009 RepID=A0AAV5A094_9AGAM|nr:hypothetical protein Clacol_001855 [Clathrus columnatus]